MDGRGGDALKRLLLLALVALAAPRADAGLCTGLVSYWKLEEASGTRVDSKGTNTLTANNTPGNAAGVQGNAVSLVSASSQYLNVTDNSSFNGLTTAASWQAWIYQTSLTNASVLTKWTYQTAGAWATETMGGGVDAFIATSLADNGNGCHVSAAASSMVINTWYHVVWVFDGSLVGNAARLKVYINGSSQAMTQVAGNVPATLITSTADFNIGKFGGSLTRYFPGRVDEAAIWSRALSSSEVTSLYNSGAGIGYGSICGGISGARAVNEGGTAGTSAGRAIQ